MYGVLIPVGAGDPIMLEKRDVTVGRKDSCDVVIRFDNVSGRHCRLILSAGYWYVIDLNSSNGVKVNDVRTKDRRIDPGDILSVAKHAFTVQYDPAKNGATGEKPPLMFQEAEIMTQSLLEKVGLQKPKQADSNAKKEQLEKFADWESQDDFSLDNENGENNENSFSTKDDSTIIAEGTQVKKNYFDQLKFD
ncbi:MAG: FHA domain-containing protein [Planctomycetaceae bacterium]|jgi:adenylate cyclase|nr:FHA domain-containing protein [Planctomycetaceae bacterium]